MQRFTSAKILPGTILFLFWITGFCWATALPEIPEKWTAEKAVAFAIDHSPDTAIAQQRIARAEAMVVMAKAPLLPKVSLSAEYDTTDNPMYSFGNILNQGSFTNSIDFNDPGFTDAAKISGQLQYRLYNGGRTRAAEREAFAGIAQAKSIRKQTMLQLGFSVIKKYQHILLAEQMLGVEKEALAAIRVSREVADARHNAGELLEQELLVLAAEESKREERLIVAEHQLELAKRSFLTLLGLESQPFSLVPEIEEQLLPEPLDSSMRPEWQELEAREKQLGARLEMAKGGKLPTIDSFASYQLEYGFENENSGHSWQAGIRLDYPLFDGHKTRAAIAAATAELARINAEKKQLALRLNLELEQARLQYQQAQKQLLVTENSERAASEAVRLSRIQFQEGTMLSSTLIDDETRLSEARAHKLAAQAEYTIAIANLRRAAGYPQFSAK